MRPLSRLKLSLRPGSDLYRDDDGGGGGGGSKHGAYHLCRLIDLAAGEARKGACAASVGGGPELFTFGATWRHVFLRPQRPARERERETLQDTPSVGNTSQLLSGASGYLK